MIVVTSLSPVHSNWESQIDSVKSWKAFGEVYSLNTSIEIDQMRLIYENDVCFVKTDKTIKHLVGKPLVSINAIIDFGISLDTDLLFINSDILIDNLPELKKDGITIFSRYDFTDSLDECKIFGAGFDAFYIPKKFLSTFPPSIYALGASWHDYWTPYMAILNKIPVYWPQGKHLFHKWHQTQYSAEEWLRIGEFFRLEFNLSKQMNIGEIATYILGQIKFKAIKY